MDKSWINKSRYSEEYTYGVQNFLELAFERISPDASILCPCCVCANRFWNNMYEVRDHLISNGFLSTYISWIYHGETLTGIQSKSDDDIIRMLHEAYNVPQSIGENDHELPNEIIEEDEEMEEPNGEYEKFASLLEDAKKELYPNCKEFSGSHLEIMKRQVIN